MPRPPFVPLYHSVNHNLANQWVQAFLARLSLGLLERKTHARCTFSLVMDRKKDGQKGLDPLVSEVMAYKAAKTTNMVTI